MAELDKVNHYSAAGSQEPPVKFFDRLWKIKHDLRNVRSGFDIPPAFEFKNIAFCPLDDAFFQSIQDRSTAQNLLLVDTAGLILLANLRGRPQVARIRGRPQVA